jgi:hypothetical protein
MNNLIQRLKQLPWRWLLQNAAIATVLVIAVELLLNLGLDVDSSGTVERVLQILYAPPFGLVVPILTAIGMGAFSVYLFERQNQQYLLNSSTLWALVFCLLLYLWIKSLLPVLPFLTSLSRYAFYRYSRGCFLER